MLWLIENVRKLVAMLASLLASLNDDHPDREQCALSLQEAKAHLRELEVHAENSSKLYTLDG
nr:MAG TPA: hypothetical protein [Microviridae sp.]